MTQWNILLHFQSSEELSLRLHCNINLEVSTKYSLGNKNETDVDPDQLICLWENLLKNGIIEISSQEKTGKLS